jgi:hypothetical protein
VWSSVNRLALNDLVSTGQLAANEEGRTAEWIVPPAGDHAPKPTGRLRGELHSLP